MFECVDNIFDKKKKYKNFGYTIDVQKKFSACEDECSGVLLKDFRNLTASLDARVKANLNNLEPPWESLREVDKKFEAVRKKFQNWKDAAQKINGFIESNIPQEIKSTAKNLLLEVSELF